MLSYHYSYQYLFRYESVQQGWSWVLYKRAFLCYSRYGSLEREIWVVSRHRRWTYGGGLWVGLAPTNIWGFYFRYYSEDFGKSVLSKNLFLSPDFVLHFFSRISWHGPCWICFSWKQQVTCYQVHCSTNTHTGPICLSAVLGKKHLASQDYLHLY